MDNFSVAINCKLDGSFLTASVKIGENHYVLDSDFDVSFVLPKSIHAVVLTAVSDALAKSFNELLSSNDKLI